MNKKTKAKPEKIYRIIYFLLTVLIVLSLIYIINFFSLRQEAKEQSNLLDEKEIYENYITKESVKDISKENGEEIVKGEIEETINNEVEETITEEKDESKGSANEIIDEKIEITERMEKVEQLQEENQDIVGWLEIENTSINYPVLQGTDNHFYMTHNYKKQKSKNGSLFLNADYNWEIPSNNLLIYGHNLGNGTMFQELLKYEKESYYKKHPSIRFTTENEDAEYEIIAVFKSRVYYKSETNVFRYYFFINSESEEEYNQFVKNAKNASLYTIDATASYGDQLITLSTCSYHVKDGRFAVVGRKK